MTTIRSIPITRTELLSLAATAFYHADECPRIGWARAMYLRDAARLLRAVGEPDLADLADRASWSTSADVGIVAMREAVLTLSGDFL